MSDALPRTGRTVVSRTSIEAHYADVSKRARHERVARHIEQRGHAHPLSLGARSIIIAAAINSERAGTE